MPPRFWGIKFNGLSYALPKTPPSTGGPKAEGGITQSTVKAPLRANQKKTPSPWGEGATRFHPSSTAMCVSHIAILCSR